MKSSLHFLYSTLLTYTYLLYINPDLIPRFFYNFQNLKNEEGIVVNGEALKYI